MLTNPDLYEIIKGQRGMLKGVESCVQSQCLVSAVALIYSTIDAISALTRAREKTKTDRTVFKAWIEKYVPIAKLGCTAADLYGARCGLLHTYSPESDLSREGGGEVKTVIYTWQTGPNPDRAALSNVRPDAILLCVEHLWGALREGVDVFLAEVERNPDLHDLVLYHARELLCYRPWTPVEIRMAA